MEDTWKFISKSIEKTYGPATRYKSQSGTITEMLAKNRSAELQAIKNKITQGLLQGKSYSQMANDIKEIIGKQMLKDGTYTVTGAKAKAMRIANDTMFGLGAGVWSRSGNTAYRAGRAIQAGRVWTNCYHIYPAS